MTSPPRNHDFCRSDADPHFDNDMPICRAECENCSYRRRTPNCPRRLRLDYMEAWRLAAAHEKRHPGHRVTVFSL